MLLEELEVVDREDVAHAVALGGERHPERGRPEPRAQLDDGPGRVHPHEGVEEEAEVLRPEDHARDVAEEQEVGARIGRRRGRPLRSGARRVAEARRDRAGGGPAPPPTRPSRRPAPPRARRRGGPARDRRAPRAPCRAGSPPARPRGRRGPSGTRRPPPRGGRGSKSEGCPGSRGRALRGRLDPERRAELLDRGLVPPLLAQEAAEVALRLEEARREADGPAVVLLRQVQLAALGVLGPDGVLDLVPPGEGQRLAPPACAEVLDGRGEIVRRLGHARGASATVDRAQDDARRRIHAPLRSMLRAVRPLRGGAVTNPRRRRPHARAAPRHLSCARRLHRGGAAPTVGRGGATMSFCSNDRRPRKPSSAAAVASAVVSTLLAAAPAASGGPRRLQALRGPAELRAAGLRAAGLRAARLRAAGNDAAARLPHPAEPLRARAPHDHGLGGG